MKMQPSPRNLQLIHLQIRRIHRFHSVFQLYFRNAIFILAIPAMLFVIFTLFCLVHCYTLCGHLLSFLVSLLSIFILGVFKEIFSCCDRILKESQDFRRILSLLSSQSLESRFYKKVFMSFPEFRANTGPFGLVLTRNAYGVLLSFMLCRATDLILTFR